MGVDTDVNCFPLAHQRATGPKRQKERKTERKHGRGSITFEYFERYKFPLFLSFQDVFYERISRIQRVRRKKKKKKPFSNLAFSKVLTSRYKRAGTVHQPLNGLYLMAGYYSAKPWQEVRTLRVKGAE